MKHSKFFQSLFCFLSLILINYTQAQYISVDPNYTAGQLVKDILIGPQNASCITVDNVTVLGANFGTGESSFGYFNKNGSVFEIDEGIILSSGKISEAVGAFPGIQSSTASGWIGDPDLENGANINNTTNATILEFDFISNQSDKISFDYMFLSEQYLRQGDPGTCGYTDGFAFLIKKITDTDYKNIAVIPGTQVPITSNNVRGAGGKCPEVNNTYFGHYNPDYGPVSFNGQTAILTARADVVPGQKYHIKLVVADQGNALYDSGVFLKAGSFTGNINIGKDLTINNADPLCENIPYRIEPNPPLSDPSAKYSWFKDGQPIVGVPINQSYYDVINEEGNFSVNVVLGSGCRLEGNVKIEKAPIAQIDNTQIMVCDGNFDGKYSARLSDFNSQIVTNFNGDFTVEYYTQSGTKINPDNDFEFTQNPQDITVKVGAFSCTPDNYVLRFYHGSQLQMNYPQQPATIPVFDVCDNELTGSKTVILDDYIGLMTTETLNPSDVKFYDKISELKADKPSINKSQTLSPTQAEKTFYIRIKKPGNYCDNYSLFKLRFKQPKKSSILKDTIICKGTTIDLDAGDGFDPALNLGFNSYKWYKESDPLQTSISNNRYGKNLPSGNYIVELGFNGCVYPQPVKISEPVDLVINNVLIEGSKVTIMASNGIHSYQYFLDGNRQSSNVIENVSRGKHTIEVKDQCGSVLQTFYIVNEKNVITPNDDGINDFIDYSDLLTKIDPRFEIYDRNGQLIFKGMPENKFIWNGKFNGRGLPTASYWYILEWNESGNPTRVQNTGWILLKNRN